MNRRNLLTRIGGIGLVSAGLGTFAVSTASAKKEGTCYYCPEDPLTLPYCPCEECIFVQECPDDE